MYFLIQKINGKHQGYYSESWDDILANIKGLVVDLFKSDSLTTKDFRRWVKKIPLTGFCKNHPDCRFMLPYYEEDGITIWKLKF